MTPFQIRAADHLHWMQNVLKTDWGYQTERGNAFTASARWEVAANSTEYLEFRIPVGLTVRVYDRVTAVSGNDFAFDLCAVDSITPGGTQFNATNMKVGMPDPQSTIWRGATSPVGLEVKEESFVPAASTGNSSGAIAQILAYRLLIGSTAPSILRVQNLGASAETFNLIILFTEEAQT